MVNEGDVINKLEELIVSVMRKKGVLRNRHEFGIVEKVLSDTKLLVASTEIEGDSQRIDCAQIADGYRVGDRVLIEYVNNSPHKKFVIAVMQKGFERQSGIDYSALRDVPARIFKKKADPPFKPRPDEILDDISTEADGIIENSYYTTKIEYDGTPASNPMGAWREIIHRDEYGWCDWITTEWPPNYSVKFNTYIRRVDDTRTLITQDEDEVF